MELVKKGEEAATINDTAMYLVEVGGVKMSASYKTSLISGNEVKAMLNKAEEYEVKGIDITWVPVEVALAGKKLLQACELAKNFMEDKKNYKPAWEALNEGIKACEPSTESAS